MSSGPPLQRAAPFRADGPQIPPAGLGTQRQGGEQLGQPAEVRGGNGPAGRKAVADARPAAAGWRPGHALDHRGVLELGDARAHRVDVHPGGVGEVGKRGGPAIRQSPDDPEPHRVGDRFEHRAV